MAKMGRPSKYSVSLQKKADAWLEKRIKKDEALWVEDLAEHLGVNDDTIVAWSKELNKKNKLKHPNFSATYRRLKARQKRVLKVGGLEGKFMSNMAIFLLRSDHSMIETQRYEVSGPDGKPIELKPIEVMPSIKPKK